MTLVIIALTVSGVALVRWMHHEMSATYSRARRARIRIITITGRQ